MERGDRQDMETREQGASMTADTPIITVTRVPLTELAGDWLISLEGQAGPSNPQDVLRGSAVIPPLASAGVPGSRAGDRTEERRSVAYCAAA